MKQYYFMRKPEVVEAEDYESKEGYPTYYYSRSDRLSRKREYPISTGKVFGRKSRFLSQRGFIILINIIIVLVIFVVWKSCSDKFANKDKFTENRKWHYYIKTIPTGGHTEVELFVQNVQKKEFYLNRKIEMKFVSKEKQFIKKIHINKNFSPNESVSILSTRLKSSKEKSLISIQIGNMITLKKQLDPSR